MFILAGKWRKMITVSKSTSEEWVIFYSIVHRGTPIWKWQGSFFLSFFLFCFVCFVFLFIYFFLYLFSSLLTQKIYFNNRVFSWPISSGAHAREAHAAEHHGYENVVIYPPRKFGNHVTVRPTVRLHHRHTNVKLPNQQAWQLKCNWRLFWREIA